MASKTSSPDEPKYTIKMVSAETGIPSITLRAWERRYHLLTPHRSENRYRQYSSRDLAILRWIKRKVDSGTSISLAVNELKWFTSRGDLPEIEPSHAPAKAVPGSASPERYSLQLYNALVAHDQARCEEIFKEAVSTFDLHTMLASVITPCLVEIGEAWARGEVRITTEHFASAYLRGKLLAMLHAYPIRRSAPYIMVGGAPTEEHEIGALMMSVLLQSEGCRVEFLGADIPLDDLVEHASLEKPAMIILTASTRSAAIELRRMQDKLNRLRSAPLFGYGGSAFNMEPALRNLIAGNFLGESLEKALARAAELLQTRAGTQA